MNSANITDSVGNKIRWLNDCTDQNSQYGIVRPFVIGRGSIYAGRDNLQ